MTTLPFDRHERSRWSGRATAYERSFARLCAHPADALLDAAAVTAGDLVLDVGTGPGTVAARALTRGATVHGVDADAGMLAVAARRVPATFSRAVLPRLPFATGSFDAVVANFVINHVGDPAAAVTELARLAGRAAELGRAGELGRAAEQDLAPEPGRVAEPEPGGRRGAVTIWPVPAPTAQSLWGEIFDAAQAVRPPSMPRVDPGRDFPRTEAGLAGLLRHAGLRNVRTKTLTWDLVIDPEDWWSGPAAGLATPGLVLEQQTTAGIAAVRAAYDWLTAPYRGRDGLLRLPTAALLAWAS